MEKQWSGIGLGTDLRRSGFLCMDLHLKDPIWHTSSGKIYDYSNHSGSRKGLTLILIDLTIVCFRMFLMNTLYTAVLSNIFGHSLRIALLVKFVELALLARFLACLVGAKGRLKNGNQGTYKIGKKSPSEFCLLEFCTSAIGGLIGCQRRE